MNQNVNVVNEIQRVKDEIIQEIINEVSIGRENLNIKELKTRMLRRVSYILKENNMLGQKDLVLGIVDNETQDFFKEINGSFDRKGNCVSGTLNNELNKVQQEYTLDKKYDLSQGLKETLNRTLSNYNYENHETKDSIQKEISNRGFDSDGSVVYQKVRSELQRYGIYNENYIDDVIFQIDRSVRLDIEAVYDEYGSIDSKLSKQIENICAEKINTLDNQLEMKKEENTKSDNDKDSKFSKELQSLTNPFDDVVNNEIQQIDSPKKNKDIYKESLHIDLW